MSPKLNKNRSVPIETIEKAKIDRIFSRTMSPTNSCPLRGKKDVAFVCSRFFSFSLTNSFDRSILYVITLPLINKLPFLLQTKN